MEDIELSSKIERLIVERYARYVKRVYGVEIVVTDNGCDNSGGYLPDCKVSTKADFLINGKPYEIKHFKPMLRELPLKADSLQSYIDQGAQILLVNGYASKHPQFTLIQPHHIQRIVDTCTTVPHKPWGGKPVYMMLKKDFNWNNLDD
jgi:hypothetical protein